VVAAAVILDSRRPIEGLADSKTLAEARREALAPVIRERALAWAVGMAAVEEIDTLNILRATMVAMQRSLAALEVEPRHVKVDGNCCPALADIGLTCTAEAIIGGDGTVAEISAASILAKTARDAWMRQAAQDYPGYGFERHKGYGTALHLQALARLGPCPLHRRSFAPVKSLELFPSTMPDR